MSQGRATSRGNATAAITKPRPLARSPYLWAGLACLAIALAVVGFVFYGRTAAPARMTAEQQADPAFIGPDLHTLVIDPKNPGHIFVGEHASAVMSTDGGRTLSQIKGLQGLDAMSWAVGADGVQQVVAGHEGLRVSTDGGATWNDLTGRLPGSDVHALGMNAGSPAQLFAYVMGKGIYRSDDQGRNWSWRGGIDLSLMGPMLVTSGGNDLIGVDMQSGLVRSTDSGSSWRPLGAGLMVTSMAVDPADPAHLFAIGSALEQSHDGGATWSTSAGSLPSGLSAIAIAPGPGTTWYGGRLSGQAAVILRSSDGGRSWQEATRTP